MGDDLADEQRGPMIALRQVAARRTGAPEPWSVEWEVRNRGEKLLKISSARLPHGQFKSDKILFEPPMELAPGEHISFQAPVLCNEPSGLVTENAFVIFQVIWSGEPWRIFARVRVLIDAAGTPAALSESITTQKVGFSGVSA